MKSISSVQDTYLVIFFKKAEPTDKDIYLCSKATLLTYNLLQSTSILKTVYTKFYRQCLLPFCFIAVTDTAGTIVPA